MDVTLSMPGAPEPSRTVSLAAMPRIGETVQLDDGPWIVRRVVHYPRKPGQQQPGLPCVVLSHPPTGRRD